jgi:deazaflavin-dependent oxidoreductase (nitroreductase family)
LTGHFVTHSLADTMPAPAKPPRPLLSYIRPFTIHVFNRFSRLFVHRLPGFAIISYPGRKTGKIYRTPMNVFRAGGAYVFALTYGSDVQWVKNVLAAGEAELQIGSKIIHLTDPELFVDPARSLMPPIARFGLRLLRVTEFMRMRPEANRSGEVPSRQST